MNRRPEQPMTPRKPTWDVNNPESRKILRAFERELNRFEGPWKFEQWLVSKGYVDTSYGYSVEMVTLPDGTVAKKPSFTKFKNGGGQFLEKWHALRILQKMTKTAEALSTGPGPDAPPAGMNL